ncbi:MAG TPA: STAS domain-containing protein [Mycobacteriales bacterium]|nr:STAS domain-containing protein [Mycobacteriales bacterium]
MVASMADGFAVSFGDDGDGTTVLTIRGDLDIATAPGLVATFDELSGSGAPAIVVDMRQVTFMDSSGLSALLVAGRRVPPGTRLVLRRPSEQVLRVLTLTGMLDSFEIEDDGIQQRS